MKLARKYRRRRGKRRDDAPRSNPGLVDDIKDTFLPGFVGFAAARFATRMATIAINKRWPRFARHAGVLASLGVVTFAYYGAPKIKALASWADGLFLGAGIGAIQTGIQTYVPAMGWVVADVAPAELQAPAAAGELESELGDTGWAYANDAFSGGRYTQQRPMASSAGVAATANAAATENAKAEDAIDSFLAEMNADAGGGGIFAGGN